MLKKRILFFSMLILVDVLVFTLEKIAAGHANAKGNRIDQFYFSLVQQMPLWIALLLGPAQLWLWTRILKVTDLSLAYPLLSLNYPFTLVAALFLGEHVTGSIWLGSFLIMVGAILLTSPDVLKKMFQIDNIKL
jgi:drug/metabolite transporter (DMT)-like permease